MALILQETSGMICFRLICITSAVHCTHSFYVGSPQFNIDSLSIMSHGFGVFSESAPKVQHAASLMRLIENTPNTLYKKKSLWETAGNLHKNLGYTALQPNQNAAVWNE